MKKENFVKPVFLWSLVFIVSMLLYPTTLLNAQQQCPAQTSTFAQFTQRFGGQDFIFTNNGGFGSFDTIGGGTPVFFQYLNIPNLPAEISGDQEARLYFSCQTSEIAFVSVGNITQPFNGTCTLQIIRDMPASFGMGSRTNLLTAVIVNTCPSCTRSDLQGTLNGNSAGYSATDPNGQQVTFTSDFLVFGNTEGRNLSLSFSSVQPNLSQNANGFLNNFSAAGSGTFASCPRPTRPPTAAAVTIGGRVLTSYGRGVAKARVSLTNSTGETFTTMTNSFGYYRFADVDSGQPVVITVSSKQYKYAPKVVNVGEDLSGLDFMPE